jgi:hypothetical protein
MGKYLDTRDLEERLRTLEDELEVLEAKVSECHTAREEAEAVNDDEETDAVQEAADELESAESELTDWRKDNEEELNELRVMRDEIPEWGYGETLVPETEWIYYVEELCVDCGYISKDFPGWIEIDWSATADNVAMDYSTVNYQGETYYYRS